MLTNKTDILNAFVADGDLVESLNAPWRAGEFVYAANRHVLVRQPAEDMDAPAPSGFSPEKMLTALEAMPDEGYVDLPEVAFRECVACHGTGTEFEGGLHARIRIGVADFAPRYVRLLRQLPGCQVAVTSSEGPAVFRFDGGCGLLMPMTQPKPEAAAR